MGRGRRNLLLDLHEFLGSVVGRKWYGSIIKINYMLNKVVFRLFPGWDEQFARGSCSWHSWSPKLSLLICCCILFCVYFQCYIFSCTLTTYINFSSLTSLVCLPFTFTYANQTFFWDTVICTPWCNYILTQINNKNNGAYSFLAMQYIMSQKKGDYYMYKTFSSSN
jgi:hypothetical protein